MKSFLTAALLFLTLATYGTSVSAQTERPYTESEGIAINATCHAAGILIEATAEIILGGDPDDITIVQSLIQVLTRVTGATSQDITSIMISEIASGKTPEEIQAGWLNVCITGSAV